ncbi:MerR family DNA-binding protein [Limibacillus sp. MBR-115]|jgi:Hg(II)-responsive transcriptional regulator|uniref:MerR family DNA-binding protein n=1 Tax=Limibacillus sp. MBR-115 TaxID=3156465 RepID=UPI00339B60E3
MSRFTISRAAKAANVNVETIRFYERKGLIEQPPKPSGGGSREYDDKTVSRIRFVRQAQEIGFSLREVGDLLSLRADPDADCADVRRRAIEKKDEVQAKLDQLSHMRDALDELIASCPGGGDVKACTILEAMERGTQGSVPYRQAKENHQGKTLK